MEKTAIKAAFAAAKVLKKHYGRIKSSDIESKGRNDYVSFVDRAAEDAIIATVRERFPDHAFLTEESGAKSGAGDVRWIIDPLDGTTNYLRMHNRFAVSVGVEKNGNMECGVVYDVLHDELFAARRGKGARLNGRRVSVSGEKCLGNALVLFGTPFRSSPARVRAFSRLFAKVQINTSDHRREGVAALDLAWVACGRAEAFYEIGLKPWDMAAGSLLVKEAGGWIGDFHGDNDDLFRKTFLSTNFRLKGSFLGLFKGSGF